jgi:hypothetical protein
VVAALDEEDTQAGTRGADGAGDAAGGGADDYDVVKGFW